MILPGNICGRCDKRRGHDCTISGTPIAKNCAAWDCPNGLFPAKPAESPFHHEPPRPPIPYDDWPMKQKVIASFRQSGDVGTGDTMDRAAARVRPVLKWLGIACGCDARHTEWNVAYPYSAERLRAPHRDSLR